MILLVQVVNTSLLIKDMDDLLSTQKIACLMKAEPSTHMIASMPRNSVLFKVYNEKTRLGEDKIKEREVIKSDRCLLETDPRIFDRAYSIFDLDAFILSERKISSIVLVNAYLFKAFFDKIWLNNRAFFEYAQVIYYTRDKPRIGRLYVHLQTENNGFENLVHSLNRFTLNRIMSYTESGMFTKMADCMDAVGQESCRASKITVFGTLKDYIEEHSKFSDLVLPNFGSIFLYYFLFFALIFFAFCMHHLLKLVKLMHIVIFAKLIWIQVKHLLLKSTLFVLRVLKIRVWFWNSIEHQGFKCF